MSARSPRHNPRAVEWRVVAVNEKTPEDHALKLQVLLTSLTDEGYNIVSVAPRGEAVIITASRFTEPPKLEAPPPPAGGGKLSN